MFLIFVPRSFFEISEKPNFWMPFIRESVAKLIFRFVPHPLNLKKSTEANCQREKRNPQKCEKCFFEFLLIFEVYHFYRYLFLHITTQIA